MTDAGKPWIGRDTAGAGALRRGRFSEANRAYFLTTVVLEKRPLLVGMVGGRVADCLVRWQDETGFPLLAFVIMPEHVHVLAVLTEGRDLGVAFGRWKAWAAKATNDELRRSGRFWQAGFYDHAIRKNEDLRDVADYIHGNPVRRGLVDNGEEFLLSSANEWFRDRMRGWALV